MLPEKVKNLVPYQPINGIFPIRLDANESFFNISEEMKEEFKKTIDEINFNRYPDPYATKLCEAFGKYYNVLPNTVTAGNGSDELISVITSLLSKGDKLLLLEPDFSMYRFYANLYELEVVTLEKDDGFCIDVDEIIDNAHRQKIDMIILSNPCNPTSILLPKEDIIKLLNNVDCIVVIDEAYMEFAKEESVILLPGKYENLIVLKTLSKAFGMAAIRLGFAISSELLSVAIRSVKSPYNVNALTQALGCSVLNNTDNSRISQIISSKEYLFQGLKTFKQFEKIYNSSTNFVMVKMYSEEEAEKTFSDLCFVGIVIKKMGQYLRITTGNDVENESFLRALERILNENG